MVVVVCKENPRLHVNRMSYKFDELNFWSNQCGLSRVDYIGHYFNDARGVLIKQQRFTVKCGRGMIPMLPR